MYPANFASLFPPFPREDKIFVAMSFDEKLKRRFTEVIGPAINNVNVNGVRQQPHRVDMSRVSDSILTEILTGITTYRAIVADLTSVGHMNNSPIRNANVMYDVGIAHALRLPEEVLLFRSDEDPLLFDLSNIRVNSYKPDSDPVAARQLVTESIIGALNEVDLKRHLAVQRLAATLDMTSWFVLAECYGQDGIPHPTQVTMRDAVSNLGRLAAIERLLDRGAMEMALPDVTPELLNEEKSVPATDAFRYAVTPLGRAVMRFGMDKMGLFKPEVVDILEDRITQGDDS